MFEQLSHMYELLPKCALRVECQIADPAVITAGLHLDSILAYSVLERETQGAMLDTSQYVTIPLPLEKLWENPHGVPLWASTDFIPDKSVVTGIRYWHRRSLDTNMTLRSIQSDKGRHKDKRNPYQTVSGVLYSDVIGNADELSSLLKTVTSVGKNRNSAGTVVSWKVYEITQFSLIDNNDCALRNIPIEYINPNGFRLDQEFGWSSFSPPYWHASTRQTCVLPGMKVLYN